MCKNKVQKSTKNHTKSTKTVQKLKRKICRLNEMLVELEFDNRHLAKQNYHLQQLYNEDINPINCSCNNDEVPF